MTSGKKRKQDHLKNLLIIQPYLLPEVQLADEQVDQIKVATVEQQVDEAQHGCRTNHLACQVSEPNHGLDDSHRGEVQAWERGDHWVPLHTSNPGETGKVSLLCTDISLPQMYWLWHMYIV